MKHIDYMDIAKEVIKHSSLTEPEISSKERYPMGYYPLPDVFYEFGLLYNGDNEIFEEKELVINLRIRGKNSITFNKIELFSEGIPYYEFSKQEIKVLKNEFSESTFIKSIYANALKTVQKIYKK